MIVLDFYKWPNDGVIDIVARLPALVLGAPALRALQLVLPMMLDAMYRWVDAKLPPLWRALEALPNLESLALGWVFTAYESTRSPARAGARIAKLLDAARVRLSYTLPPHRRRPCRDP